VAANRVLSKISDQTGKYLRKGNSSILTCLAALLQGIAACKTKRPAAAGRQYPFALLARGDDELDGGSFFSIDVDIRKGGDGDQVDAIGGHIASADGDGLDGLIDSSGSHGLNLGCSPFAQHCRQGAGYCFGWDSAETFNTSIFANLSLFDDLRCLAAAAGQMNLASVSGICRHREKVTANLLQPGKAM
jgi:hypothetical protein